MRAKPRSQVLINYILAATAAAAAAVTAAAAASSTDRTGPRGKSEYTYAPWYLGLLGSDLYNTPEKYINVKNNVLC